ncbi:MAG: lactate utilization protein [Thermodesulfovibrionales bacterium]|nr:lactate utilization protein [Thermodesulfovibrionales bacterium]
MNINSLFELFKTKAEAINAEVYRFATKREALGFIIDICNKEGISDKPYSYALWANCPFLKDLDKEEISKRLPGLKYEVTKPLAAHAKIGISQMDWAIANTGTLVSDSTQIEQRLVSTLPEIHVAVVQTSQLVPDLASLLSQIKPDRASFIALITGPSRTADIERILTIGVHGPERLVIVFVDEN